MLKKILQCLLLFACSVVDSAQVRYCAVCSELLPERFLVGHDQKFYCNTECFEATLPRCSNCGKICRGRFIHADGRDFCSRKCADDALLTRCMRCGNPFRTGKELQSPYGMSYYCADCGKYPACLICERLEKDLRQLPNGNYLCRQCDVDVIDSTDRGKVVFLQVRKLLAEKFQFNADHEINFVMRSFGHDEQDELVKSREFGLYQYQAREIYTKPLAIEFWREKKTTVRFENETCTIVAMNYLPRFKLAEVIAHELAHDYMLHRWRYVRDPKLREGFAELIAAEYNRLTGNEKWNYRMEISKDPVYGAGYRLLRLWFKKGSWQEIQRRLDAANYAGMPSELK